MPRSAAHSDARPRSRDPTATTSWPGAAWSAGTTWLAAIPAVDRIPQRSGGSIVVSLIVRPYGVSIGRDAAKMAHDTET